MLAKFIDYWKRLGGTLLNVEFSIYILYKAEEFVCLRYVYSGTTGPNSESNFF